MDVPEAMKEQIFMIIFCSAVSLGGLLLGIWLLLGGSVGTQGIDSLFLALVCLMMALAFSFVPIQAFRKGLFRGLLRRAKHAPAAPPERPDRAQAPEAQERSSGG